METERSTEAEDTGRIGNRRSWRDHYKYSVNFPFYFSGLTGLAFFGGIMFWINYPLDLGILALAPLLMTGTIGATAASFTASSNKIVRHLVERNEQLAARLDQLEGKK